ncbi:hypothetical protein MIND_00317400 [Mycena indigotica]|uniref:Uncharacterized protein n=1 Tax=Mycena indigotica TaxID=2126181 RepID=A0A8H6WAS9_9AGAR|nr:uncharacterized protein MIND_00317400 [Mycena indigotica]KAF7309466.1 hypothetical protein MIND_00317400 [Mycena indigotica]
MLPNYYPLPVVEAPLPLRPRGLWKGRETHKRRSDSDHNHRPTKRQRSEDTSDEDQENYYIVELTPEPTPEMESEEEFVPEKVEDWEDLKSSFARAVEQYENDNFSESVQLLRGVLRLCHRFLLLYQDPSVLYTQPQPKLPEPISFSSLAPRPRKKCKCREPTTAFHAILGTTLFLFANIIAQDPSVALSGEPTNSVTYWLAALDVFEMGENLPSRTSGRGCEAPEDWRMNVVWGRVLLCIADAALTQQRNNSSPVVEPKWLSPSASVFAAIQMRRPPASRRISLASAVPHELLLLAMDHFTRGIFLMPHTVTPTPINSSSPQFSRAAELFTIALEFLGVAERLPAASERMRWAAWADNVLGQIPAQGQTAVIGRIRGRCWLVYGTAHVEDIEETGESRDWDDIFDSEDAEDARDGLQRAIGFFERAAAEEGGSNDDELQAFLAESLLTLANLTKEEIKREELYQRAQSLGCVSLDEMES